MRFKNIHFYSFVFVIVILFGSCSRKVIISTNANIPPLTGNMEMWMTTADSSVLLQKQPSLSFSEGAAAANIIDIDPAQVFQTIDGFGYCLTGGSATLINRLDPGTKAALLNELFSTKGIGVSYLRVSIGASDLNPSVFSYDDMPPGQTDPNLSHFSIQPDMQDLIPVLREIISINPNMKLLGSPWSAPAWMKDNGSTIGGSLLPQYYSVYAQYFVKYIQQMKQNGITIDAITPQNEPLNPKNNPSLYMTAAQQADFIKNNLGPAFRTAGINTKIWLYDHNADRPDYPLYILNDAAANPYVDGSAFHLYGGDVSALGEVHTAFPNKNIYFTEQWTGAKENFEGNLRWHLKNVIIGTMRNWSRVALEWNLANDPSFEPHTPGGCSECKGALTIGNGVNRNVSYYIVAHASKFVPPGSVRIGSNVTGALNNVAFKRPDGKKVLIVENDGPAATGFSIRYNNQLVRTSLPGGGVATYIW
jgi:glucosylceramidase